MYVKEIFVKRYAYGTASCSLFELSLFEHFLFQEIKTKFHGHHLRNDENIGVLTYQTNSLLITDFQNFQRVIAPASTGELFERI